MEPLREGGVGEDIVSPANIDKGLFHSTSTRASDASKGKKKRCAAADESNQKERKREIDLYSLDAPMCGHTVSAAAIHMLLCEKT